jgi:hypothetical protein
LVAPDSTRAAVALETLAARATSTIVGRVILSSFEGHQSNSAGGSMVLGPLALNSGGFVKLSQLDRNEFRKFV